MSRRLNRPHPLGLVSGMASVLLGLAAASLHAQDTTPEQHRDAEAGPSLGLLFDGTDPSSPAGWAWPAGLEIAPARPLHARLVAQWQDVEREAGVYDWSALDFQVEQLAGAGLDLVLCLTGSNALHVPPDGPDAGLPSPGAGRALEAWVAFARSAVRRFGAKVAVYEIWDAPQELDPVLYAFLLKNTALGLRAEARVLAVPVRVSQGVIAPDALQWQRTVWAQDVAPYVDLLPVRVGARDLPAGLDAVYAESLQVAPAPDLWVHVRTVDPTDPWAAAAVAVRALAGPVAAALYAPAVDPGIGEAQLRWTAGLHRLLSDGYAQAPLGVLSLEPVEGGRVEGDVLARLFKDEGFETLVLFRSRVPVPPGEQAFVRVDAAALRNPRVRDPLSGQEWRTVPLASTGGDGTRLLRVYVQQHPMALIFGRMVAEGGIEAAREEVGILTRRGLTAEEIIARHREVQKVQDDRLERWTTRSRVDFHYKLAQAGATVDVGIVSSYFWQRREPLEWEQLEYYLNGNRLQWKEIPELPLIQPEKVATLPLDLTLDRSYAYRLLDEDRVDGHDAYVLAFEPVDPNAPLSLYRGRVWIDKQTFVRLRASVLQTNLEAPVVSNEELDIYRPFPGPDGFTYWLLGRIEGQQHWTLGGRNLVVRREQEFPSYEINPPTEAFGEARRKAYVSSNLMVRDTAEGNRYLERQPDGTRTVKTTTDTDKLFAAGGVYKDQSVDNLLPLGGVNWFDFDFRGRGIQTNVFFAGVLAFVNASKPDLFGRNFDLTADAAFSAIKTDDKVFTADVEDVPQRVRTRTQFAAIRFGVPSGQFIKVTLVGSASFQAYFESDEAADFVLPADHRVTTGSLEAEFNRKGWSLSGSGAWSARSRWDPWGPVVGGVLTNPDFDPDQKSFSRWGATAFKEWYLPKFQKVKAEVNLLDGANLDRFSRYAFTFFGDTRLNGFSGSGVRFDRGAILRAGYSFNLFEVVRLDAVVDTGRVEEKDSPLGSRSFTGLGLSGNVIGPWKTVISGSYGRAMASDIPELQGQQEFLLVILKLFR